MKKTLITFLLCSVPVLATVNLALDKPANASQHFFCDKGGLPMDAVDGDLTTEWNAGWWAEASSPQWIVVDLQSVYSVGKISLWDETDGIDIGWSNDYNLYSSLNTTQWELLGSGTLYDSTDYLDEYLFNGKDMQYVKYEVVGGSHFAHICEIEVYEIPEPCTLLLLGLGGVLIRRK
jgi:hypothetical protein